ncbi:hypothetical protein [Gimesia panareensis]|uniref:hypothetical protein n=1 Tax=Gimesia panareensis TaxID=2527978 RepID=UPI0011A9CDAD|nr:hypothetical protein [Gimesia panareensis]
MIRACLLLSLWSLPFPWLHNHHLHQGTEAASSWLPIHLDQYHGGVESPEEGWHLHFVYFGGERSGDPLNQKFPPRHYFVVGESADSLPAQSLAASQCLEQFLSSASFCTSSIHSWFADSDFQKFTSNLADPLACSSQSTREFTSVSRC